MPIYPFLSIEAKTTEEYLNINLYEEHGKGHWKVCISLEGNMAVTHLQVVERQNSLEFDMLYWGRWGIMYLFGIVSQLRGE